MNRFFYYTGDYPFTFSAIKIAGSLGPAINSIHDPVTLSRRDIFPQVVLDRVGCGFSAVIDSKF
jgi:hypothetical protein